MNHLATTLDGILDSQLMIEQPAKGFRVAIDTILLAAFTPAQTGQRVLELGCGVGGAMLALGHRVKDATIIGLDLQEELITLCEKNIARNINALQSKITVQQGDVTNPSCLFAEPFDWVMMNPPYHDATAHDPSPHRIKEIANMEKDGDLARWIQTASRALASTGGLTLIHRADRQDDILALLAPSFPFTQTMALLPKRDRPAKRIIVWAGKEPLHLHDKPSFLILHQENGRYTDPIEFILRGKWSR